jgi:lambda family phage portal protein
MVAGAKRAFSREVKPQAKRGYAGAVSNRFTADWWAENKTANSEIRESLSALRARSRDGERNNAYLRKFGASLEANVIGSEGVKLQMGIQEPNGTPDTLANDAVENAWWEAGKSFSVDGMSWHAIKCMVLRRTAFDGEIILRKHILSKEKHPAKLELIEADRLDHTFNTTQNGNRVIMGVEIDRFGKPVAYHILNYIPSDIWGLRPDQNRTRERVPADEIIHIFVKERPGQLRGVPWTAAILSELHQLQGFEEAEVIAARASAQKMGFFSSPEGEEYKGEQDSDGSTIMEAEAGTFENIGRLQFTAYDPKHPNGNFSEFTKTVVRKLASGLGESYNSLANDLEGVNYSSLRGGVLDAREGYKMRQQWFIEAFVSPVFEWWLEIDLTAGIPMKGGAMLPLRKFDKFNSPDWQGRRWQWVDPVKELVAIEKALELNITSRSRVLAEQGEEIEETFILINKDKQLADKLGIDLAVEKVAAAVAPPPPKLEPDDE